MSKQTAILISDVHYSLQTLELADAAMRQAITKANELRVPLIVAGDLHDTKANLRGECVNAMIETFKLCNSPPYILIGNHDKINERSTAHSLNFLAQYGMLIEKPTYQHKLGWLLPYYSDTTLLKNVLQTLKEGDQLIMHQGLQGTNSGEYFQDKSAITHEDVKDFRVISGHYHCRQDVKTGRPRKGAVGLFSYIGNPFTTSFGEANDPEKGFQILMDDGTLEFVPTKLRKHVIIEVEVGKVLKVLNEVFLPRGNDLVWVKAYGDKHLLNDRTVFEDLLNRKDFRHELIPTTELVKVIKKTNSMAELLDSLIDGQQITEDTKERLKSTWKNLCE